MCNPIPIAMFWNLRSYCLHNLDLKSIHLGWSYTEISPASITFKYKVCVLAPAAHKVGTVKR